MNGGKKMKKQEVKKQERKSVQIGIRTFPSYSKFMKEEGLSPNAIFNKSIEELMKEK